MKVGNDDFRIRGKIKEVAIGRDRVAAVSDQMLAIFDAATGACCHRVFKSESSVAFSHDGTSLAVGGHARVIDLQTLETRWEAKIDSSPVTYLTPVLT